MDRHGPRSRGSRPARRAAGAVAVLALWLVGAGEQPGSTRFEPLPAAPAGAEELAALLETALLEDEEARAQRCRDSLPGHRRLWSVCEKRIDLEFDLLAGCYRHISRLQRREAAEDPLAARRAASELERRVARCHQEDWRRVVEVEADWMTAFRAQVEFR